MWLQFGIKDIIDIFLVAFLLFQSYRVMKTSGTLTIFSGIVSFVAVWILVSQIFEMRLLGAILDKFISVGFIAIIILFQDEIRRFLLAIGLHQRWKDFALFFKKEDKETEVKYKFIAPVVLACINMAKKKSGALIVIQQNMDLTIHERTGERFDADINARLIENIFFKNSPLHDGAMIIANNKIRAAGCILPIVKNAEIPKEMGLRHRAGLAMSIETDAIVIIVSEERGAISVASKGILKANITSDELQQILSKEKENDTIN